MHDYDFNKLNDKEFEAFSIDLLSGYLKYRIERFKAGKDSGVDGRFFVSEKDEAIVQCKHWAKSGVDALVRQLKKVEAPKLDKLKPTQYFLVTSLPLSRKNKMDIQGALSPWIRSGSDIFGQEDLNSILGKHPEVEERHHKLWFSSVQIMSRLQNASIKGRSDFEIADAESFAPKYVRTSSHVDAVEKLEKLGVIIITGEPGIGKSTLAKQIVIQYALKDFEICCIAENPDEAERVWRKNAPQLFYFDDFLGRNYLVALRRHEDSHIIGLIKRIRSDSSKRFILTSRTTVLNRGKSLSDLFRIENIDRNEYELKIPELSLIEKAQILYNHIWHSSLPRTYIKFIYKDARYLKIVQHTNFNPRLISFITDFNKVEGIRPSRYWKFIRETLDDPRDIWAHVFDNQLDVHSALLVRLTIFNGRDIEERQLQTAFASYNAVHGDSANQLDKFGVAIRLTVGSVLNRQAHEAQAPITYNLFNPSVGDYIVRRYKNDQYEIANCLYALQTEESLDNLNALLQSGIIEFNLYHGVIETLGSKFLHDEAISLSYRLELAQLQIELIKDTRIVPNSIKQFIRMLVAEVNENEKCGVQAKLLTFGFNHSLMNGRLDDLLIKSNALIEQSWGDDDFDLLSDFIDCLPATESAQLSHQLANEVERYWRENIGTIMFQEDVLDEYNSLDELESAKSTLRNYIERRVSSINATIDIDSIMDAADVEEVIESNSQRIVRRYDDPQVINKYKNADADEVEAVHDLFER